MDRTHVLAGDERARECLRALSRSLGSPDACLCQEPGRAGGLDLGEDAVFAVDTERRIVFLNGRASALLGIAPEDALGRSCHEGMRCAHHAHGCALTEEGANCARHVEIHRPDGARVTCLKSLRLLRDGSGRTVGAVETLRDISDLRREQMGLEKALEQVRARSGLLELFAECMDEGLGALDRDGCVVALSSRAAQYLSVSLEQARGARLADLLGDGAAAVTQAVHGALEGRCVELHQVSIPRRCCTVRLRMSPLAAEGSPQPLGAVFVLAPEADSAKAGAFCGMLGQSAPMQLLFARLRTLADIDATVLITGESGTGKELVARALHDAGMRRGRPFHAVNCAALPEQLLESELFGHERGAFTGAYREKTGRFALCEDGTLLLDEVACLPLGTQAKLLRVLESREYERVGGTRTLQLNARVLAATNAELGERVRAGAFRADLFYRLSVLPLVVPPLRERREDIALLARHFAARFAPAYGRPAPPVFSARAVKQMGTYSWPGNVRELLNAVQHALLVAPGATVDVTDLPAALQGADRDVPGSADAMPTQPQIDEALRTAGGNRARAAAILGVNRTTLWRWMRRRAGAASGRR